jgi:hypothetical protein
MLDLKKRWEKSHLFWFIVYLYNKNSNMKNKLFLEEGEIARILNMHKRAIREELNVNGDEVENNQVQMDEELSEDGELQNTLAGAAVGTYFLPGYGTVIGGAIGYFVSLSNGHGLEGAQKILKACSTKKAEIGKPTMNVDYLTKLADKINRAVEGSGTYEEAIASGLRQTKYIPNLCAMAAIYKQRHGEGLFDAIDGDIDSDYEWKQYVFLPILDVVNASVELGKKAKQEQSKVGGGGAAPTSGEVYQKCVSIIKGMVGYGFTYVTLDVFNQAPADKKKYIWCPAGKSNVYFTKGWSGGSGKNPGDDGPPSYNGGGGKTYTFDVAAVNKLIDTKCPKDGKAIVAGGNVNLDGTGTLTPTPIPNMPKDMVGEF